MHDKIKQLKILTNQNITVINKPLRQCRSINYKPLRQRRSLLQNRAQNRVMGLNGQVLNIKIVKLSSFEIFCADSNKSVRRNSIGRFNASFNDQVSIKISKNVFIFAHS